MKFIKTLLFISLTLTTFASCSNEDDLQYSCDKTIDIWVKSHLTEIHQMDRKEWLNTDISTGIAIYRAFTPQQRIQFWRDKMKEVKAMKWSKQELLHIQKVEDFINKHLDFFSGKKLTDEQLDELETFFYKWKKDGELLYEWNDEVAIAIAGTGNRVMNTAGKIVSRTGNISSDVSISRSDCHCNRGFFSDFCNDDPGPCEQSNCDEKDAGCGWLFVQTCNGRCGGI